MFLTTILKHPDIQIKIQQEKKKKNTTGAQECGRAA